MIGAMGALATGRSGIGAMMDGLGMYLKKMKDEVVQAVDGLHEGMASIDVRLDYNGPLIREKIRHLKMRFTSLRGLVGNGWDEKKPPCSVEMRTPLMRSWLLYEHDTMRCMASDEVHSIMVWMSFCTLCYIRTFKDLLRMQVGVDEVSENPFGTDWI